VEVVYDSQSNPMQLMMAIMELSRGHSESAMKSERVGGAWQEKKRLAAEEGVPLTKRCPAWLRLVDGQWGVIEGAAETIRYIFRLATDGHGVRVITKRLNAEEVPPIGAGKSAARYWVRSYVAKILSNPAAVGVYQPCAGRGSRRRPDGDAIPGYFPPIVSQEEWDAARGALESRKNRGGRESAERVNLFANLLRDARDGGPIHQKNNSGGKGGRTLVSSKATCGVIGSKFVSFPLPTLESAILSFLHEIDPRDILPHNGGADKTLVLSGKLAQVEGRIAKLKAKLETDGDLDTVWDVLRDLEAKRKELVQDLAHARQEAASPLASGWADCQSLVDVLNKAPDQTGARIKLRAAIRRVVKSVWCLFVARGSWRLAALQLWFTGGAHRDYLILHSPATGGWAGKRPSRWWARSLAEAAGPAKLDLRKTADVQKLDKVLAALDLAALAPDGAEAKRRKNQ
jgi:hypothetical protein